MVKAAELRIGNWIYDYNRSMVKAKVTPDYFHNIDHNGEINCSPIDLSFEILEACDFQDTFYFGSSLHNFKHESVFWTILFDNEMFYLVDYERSKWGLLKHLHQLQNLYFAIMGEELDVDFKRKPFYKKEQ